jgi:hypothetical protein
MSNTNDYVKCGIEREEGHIDTCSNNFEFENKYPHLGYDLGIGMAG